MSHIVLLRLRGQQAERERARAGLADSAAAVLTAEFPDLDGTLFTGIDEPREMNLYRDGDDFSPPFDLALKAYGADDQTLRNVIDRLRELGDFESPFGFRTEETVMKTPTSNLPSGVLPGVCMLHPLRFHADLPRTALLRSWRSIHGDLAVDAHSGATYYAQHLVVADLANATPTYGGFSEFWFPDRAALIGGYFRDESARKAVRHDIRHFIDGVPPRLFATARKLERP